MRHIFFVAMLIFLFGCGTARVVTIDISDEMICKSQFLTNTSSECLSEDGCRSMCEDQACKSYLMSFSDSNLIDGQCNCDCLAENKIRTVAKYYDQG